MKLDCANFIYNDDGTKWEVRFIVNDELFEERVLVSVLKNNSFVFETYCDYDDITKGTGWVCIVEQKTKR